MAPEHDAADACADVVFADASRWQVEGLDQVWFRLDEAAYAAFMALLEDPHEPTDALRELMRTPAPWE